MNTHIVWFIAKTKEEWDQLLSGLHGKILICNRMFFLETKGSKSVEEMQQLHKVHSIVIVVSHAHPQKWSACTSKLPHKCVHYHANLDNNKCKYMDWQQTHEVKFSVSCLYPEGAVKQVGVRIIQEKQVDNHAEELCKSGLVFLFLKQMGS